MFDATIYDFLRSDTLARNCREPGDRWCLDRRTWRPAPPVSTLPRVARG